MTAFDLTGRVAVVTGGNGGIGLGMARGLAQAGASVVIVGRNGPKNAAAVQELAALGAKAVALEADVADEAACRGMAEAAWGAFGRLDILVNNAGIARRRRPEAMSLSDWNAILQTNLTAALVAAQGAYPMMKAAGGGKIINIGSMYSLFGAPYISAYAASKGGLVQLTKSLAAAWAEDNIQVNAILPGWIDTDMTRPAAGASPATSRDRRCSSPAAPPISSPAPRSASTAATRSPADNRSICDPSPRTALQGRSGAGPCGFQHHAQFASAAIGAGPRRSPTVRRTVPAASETLPALCGARLPTVDSP